MSTTFETRDGVDVFVDVSPDTPAAWKRVNRALARIDRLASELAAIDPDWSIDITVSGIPITTITAEPATTGQEAA
jgi:HAMP domain-containing protein